jgi:iron complex outermembrane receptor protein
MRKLTIAAALLCFCAFPIASAAELEEIIVTATKRETSLMDISTAVTAFDADKLEALNIDNAQDLVARTPSLTMTGTPSKISIRGVGRPHNALGTDPGVATYTDGVYSTESGNFEYTNFFDIERVEILRGPQGTLYGRNAVGGAINLVTMGPTPDWHVKVVAEVGNYDYRVLQGLLRGPVSDDLSIAVAASTIRRDGYQKDVNSGRDLDDRGTDYLRATFRYIWNDNWSTRIQASRVDLDRTPSNGYRTLPFDTDYVQVVSDVDSGAPLNLPGVFPGNNFINYYQDYPDENAGFKDESKTQTDVSPRESTEVNSIYMLNEVLFSGYRLRYLASYFEYEYDKLVDSDGIVAARSNLNWDNLYIGGVSVSQLTGISRTPPMVTEITAQEADFTSHDLQLYSEFVGRLNFVAGLYYYRGNEDQLYAVHEANDELMAVYTFLGSLVGRNTSTENWLYRGESTLETTSWAGYGQLEWDWTDKLRLTAGLRYSRDNKDGGDNTFVQWVGDGFIDRASEDDWDSVDWRLGLDYRASPGHLWYASAATGYRSGGFNYMKPTASTDVDTVEPEDLLAFEVGYKGSLWDNRLQLSSALYYYDYEDLQVLRQDVVNGVPLFTFDNADSAEAYGVEIEAVSQLTEHLQLGGAYSYNHAQFETFYSKDANACNLGPLLAGRSQDPLCTDAQNLRGNTVPLTPDHKFNLFASLGWQLGKLDMSLTANYMYVGKQYMSSFNVDEYDLIDAWDRWDALYTVSPRGSYWSLTAFVKNINDDREVVFRPRPSTVHHNHTPAVQVTEPRSYGLRFVYEF